MTSTRYWAIGLKGWVQIRVAKNPPTAKVTSTKIKTKHRYYNFWNNNYQTSARVKTIKQCIYEGGKIKATLNSNNFKKLSNFSVSNGKMVELAPTVYTTIMENRNV